MALTPEEIVNYPLNQVLRGYSIPEVDELLDEVADTVEALERELTEVRERLSRSETRLAETSETERTLKRTLVTAQRAAEQSIAEAEEQAEEIVADARRQAEDIVADSRRAAEELREQILQEARTDEAEARRRRRELERHLDELRAYELQARGRIRGMLEEQLVLLEQLGTGGAPEGPPVPPAAEEEVARAEDGPAEDGAAEDGPASSGPVEDATGGSPDAAMGEDRDGVDAATEGTDDLGTPADVTPPWERAEERGRTAASEDPPAGSDGVDPDPTDPTDPTPDAPAPTDPGAEDAPAEAGGDSAPGGRPPPAAAPPGERETLWPPTRREDGGER